MSTTKNTPLAESQLFPRLKNLTNRVSLHLLIKTMGDVCLTKGIEITEADEDEPSADVWLAVGRRLEELRLAIKEQGQDAHPCMH